jgi:GeoRSP system SPASM domain protein
MTLDQLDNPIRATWDLLTDAGRMSADNAATVLQKILDAQLFFVTLEQRPLAHSDCDFILRQLVSAGIQVLLLTDGRDDELEHLDLLSSSPVAVLIRLQPFITPEGPDFDRLGRVVDTMHQAGVRPGFSLTPRRSNVDFLESLFRFAKERQIARFKLPNVRIDDNFLQVGTGDVLRPDDLDALQQNLPDLRPLIDSLELEIHDLFLWELLTPDSDKTRSEYGGCQAANSLAHINIDGSVWPCVSWPEPLGSLLQSSFAELWSSEACQTLRQKIAARPSGCAGCADYQLCFGGCRGLSEVLDVDEGLDPMCSGPR